MVAPARHARADPRQAQRRHQRRLKSPETKAALDRFSSIAKIGTPREFGAFIAEQGKRWGELVKLAGAKDRVAQRNGRKYCLEIA